MSQKPVRYDLKKAKVARCRVGDEEIFAFTMREVNGQDEEVAANYAKSKGGAATTPEEMVRLAIVAVNDKPVQQPYLKFDVWNQRGRAFALRAFNDLNGLTAQEADLFIGTAEEVDDQLPLPPAEKSANG